MSSLYRVLDTMPDTMFTPAYVSLNDVIDVRPSAQH